MSFQTLVLPLMQSTLQGFIDYKMAQKGKEIAIKSARFYVQGIRAARIAALVFYFLAALCLINIFAMGLFAHAIFLVYSNLEETRSSWIMGEFIFASLVFLCDLIVLIAIANQSLWMRVFKVPTILENALRGGI